MTTIKNKTLSLYQILGKLFYAIAAADNDVHKIEFEKLKELVKKHWLELDVIKSTRKTDGAHEIEISFDCLSKEGHLDAETCFDAFVDYKNDQPHMFTKQLNALILKTAHAIAASFSGLNKSELIMLAKLELELKN